MDFGKKKKKDKKGKAEANTPEESDEPEDPGAKKKGKKDDDAPNGKKADAAAEKFDPPSRAGDGLVVAKVVQVEKIPKKDKLRILKLKFADEGPLAKVVTNAPNVQQGDF